MMGSFCGQRKPVYTVGAKVLYCKLSAIGKKLPTFPHRVWGLNQQPQRWEASVNPTDLLDSESIYLGLLT